MNRHITTAALLLALASSVGARTEDGQRRETEGVEPTVEQGLRDHLRKLEGWGVNQLLRTERRVDALQKRRANTSSNPQELALLADDEDLGVRFYVAANPNTPLATLAHLARDPQVIVRSGVAMALRYDPRQPLAARQLLATLAARLAGDGNVLVRLTLVESRSLPPSVFDLLAADPDFMVRRKLALNLDAPRHVLAQLATDSVRSVQIEALRHRNQSLAVLSTMATDPSPVIRRAVCGNVNAPLTLLDALADDTDPEVRRLVARHPNTPLRTLWRLARDTDPQVVIGVAEHRHADRALLTELAADARDPRVRLAAQDHLKPLLRREIRDDILERWETE